MLMHSAEMRIFFNDSVKQRGKIENKSRSLDANGNYDFRIVMTSAILALSHVCATGANVLIPKVCVLLQRLQ